MAALQQQRRTISSNTSLVSPEWANFLWQRPAIREHDKLAQIGLELSHPPGTNDRCPPCFQTRQDRLSFPNTAPATLCEENDLPTFVRGMWLAHDVPTLFEIIHHLAGILFRNVQKFGKFISSPTVRLDPWKRETVCRSHSIKAECGHVL